LSLFAGRRSGTDHKDIGLKLDQLLCERLQVSPSNYHHLRGSHCVVIQPLASGRSSELAVVTA
jgi:hypothetical protein